MPSKTEVDLSVNGAFSEIYVHDGAVAQTITTGAGYTKSTAYTDAGDSKNSTADFANDKLILTNVGNYEVECSLSFTGTGVNVNWFGSVFVDGVESDKIHFERKIGTGGDFGSTQFGGLVHVTTAPVDIDMRFRHDSASDQTATVKYSNLKAVLIGTV